MPLGSGILPAGAIGNQLSYITRRAVMPKAVVQIYNASPTTCGLVANAKREAGGIDSVIVNVQYAQFLSPQYTSFNGNFNAPTAVQGLTPASWSMTEAVCPIPIFINELAIQEQQEIQSILNLRFTDAGNAMRDMIANSIFTNTANTLAPLGFPAAIDDGTSVALYGGINRSTNTWWQSKKYNAGAVNLTRALALQWLTGGTKQQGEKPNFGVCGFATWLVLAQDYLGLERYIPGENVTDTYVSGFDALMVAGVPIYADPYCPEGTLYFVNTNYLTFRIHQNFEWEFMDFESMIPAFQLAYTGVVIMIGCLVNTKPKASVQVFNLNFPTI
jgi:hypothetical protein